jgi:hypothetical protein
MMETLQAQSALFIAQQHKMAMLERNVQIMGDRLRMHDTKFDCLVAVEPEVVNYPQWLPVERFRLLDAAPVRDIVVPHFTFPENVIAPGEVGRPLFRDADTEANNIVRERGSVLLSTMRIRLRRMATGWREGHPMACWSSRSLVLKVGVQCGRLGMLGGGSDQRWSPSSGVSRTSCRLRRWSGRPVRRNQ